MINNEPVLYIEAIVASARTLMRLLRELWTDTGIAQQTRQGHCSETGPRAQSGEVKVEMNAIEGFVNEVRADTRYAYFAVSIVSLGKSIHGSRRSTGVVD